MDEKNSLNVISRLPDPTEVCKNEFQKSRATRSRILEAAIDCLATIGYQATSTTIVAKYAGLTRAAMLYHFPNRLALIEAVVNYVTRRRVEIQEEAHLDMPRDEEFHYRSLDSNWAQLQCKEYFAFSELSMASRTDPELDAIFQPAMAAYDLYRRDAAYRIATETKKSDPGFDLRRDLTRFALEGLAQQKGITFNRDKRMAELMWFLKVLWDEEISGDLVNKAMEMAAAELSAKTDQQGDDDVDG